MFKSISSVFFLILFLFPQIQKMMHEFEHRNDTHCDAKTELHFHSQEHICDLCDFTVALGIPIEIGNGDELFQTVSEYNIPAPLSYFFPDAWSFVPSRAPPSQIS